MMVAMGRGAEFAEQLVAVVLPGAWSEWWTDEFLPNRDTIRQQAQRHGRNRRTLPSPDEVWEEFLDILRAESGSDRIEIVGPGVIHVPRELWDDDDVAGYTDAEDAEDEPPSEIWVHITSAQLYDLARAWGGRRRRPEIGLAQISLIVMEEFGTMGRNDKYLVYDAQDLRSSTQEPASDGDPG